MFLINGMVGTLIADGWARHTEADHKPMLTPADTIHSLWGPVAPPCIMSTHRMVINTFDLKFAFFDHCLNRSPEACCRSRQYGQLYNGIHY